MMEGGHESGILNSFDRAEADDRERVSSDSPGLLKLQLGLGLRGVDCEPPTGRDD
jgi:hypothetical protein